MYMYKFKISTRRNKKYDVYKNDKYLISFRSRTNNHYRDTTTLRAWSRLDHLDQKRKDNYYKRFGKDAKYETAKWFSHKYLWN